MYTAPVAASDGSPNALVLFLELAAEEGGHPPDHGSSAARTLKDAESELDGARAHLQEMVDASETRQEELRAANEELQSINEEYKSTLEELETSKEELQSMNEELSTVNAELNIKLTELAHANDDLRNLMAATEIATLFLDRSLRIMRFTPALGDIFNVMPVDEGRPLHHVTHKLDYDGLRDDCDRVLRRLQPVEREVADSEGRSWLARLTPYRTDEDRISGVILTFTDVSRVRAAQRHVRESEERFRTLVDASAEIVWTTNPAGAVVEDSPTWRAFTGQSTRERSGSGWLDAVHPAERTGLAAEWKRAVESGEELTTEFRIRHGDSGEWRLTAVRVLPVVNADGSIREWVAMNTDITEQRAAEQALRDAKAAAERAADAKSQFLATMSHELRTPLTAVIGLSELMETEVVGAMNDVQKRHLRRIKMSAWHLVSIIEEVLTFSRSEAGMTVVHRTTTDVADITRGVLDVLEVSATDKNVALRMENGADRPEYAFSDPGKLRQVITNLVGNAIKFTDDGEVVVTIVGEPRWVELHVQDTGPGIPEDKLETIFEPFVQLEPTMTREKGGAGLGLAVSRRLARLLGGEVEVHSTVGEGSSFVLRLPRQAEEDVRRVTIG